MESWPSGMPHQEIYLAALDEQASAAYARLARIMNKADEADSAEARAQKVTAAIEQEYAGRMYAFSRNVDGTLDKTATIYPTIAWWDGHYALKQSGEMFKRWASMSFRPIGGCAIWASTRRFMIPSAITKAQCGRSSLAGLRWLNIARGALSPAMLT